MPGAELLIALAGPAVNFAIVAGLLGLELLGIGGMESDTSLGGFLAGLMLVNLILGLFNLIPAFPMDGGRVLRALLTRLAGPGPGHNGRGHDRPRPWPWRFGVYSLFQGNLFQVALAAFIYFVAGAEESGVIAEERKRAYYTPQDQGIWTAPPGYHWVQQGNGVWQLAPVVVTGGGIKTEFFVMGRLTPIVELGVAEAFAILTEQLGVSRESLPPLDAIENEDWGRDLLLEKLQEIDDRTLATVGLSHRVSMNDRFGCSCREDSWTSRSRETWVILDV